MKKYSVVGILGTIFGILAIFFLIIFSLEFNRNISNYYVYYSYYSWLMIPFFGFISMLVGGVARWGEKKDDLGIVGFLLGLVAIICFIIIYILMWYIFPLPIS